MRIWLVWSERIAPVSTPMSKSPKRGASLFIRLCSDRALRLETSADAMQLCNLEVLVF